MKFDRRSFLACTAIALPLLSATRLGWADIAGDTFVFDPTLQIAVRVARQVRTRGVNVQPIDGDRVRFVRALLVDRPARIYGLSRYADRLLMTDIAREDGYRLLAASCHRSDCVRVERWVLARPRRSIFES